MTWCVLTSDGEVHVGEDPDEYVAILDEYGPEVVDSWSDDPETNVNLGVEEGGE